MGPNANRQAQQIEQTQIDAAAKRRIHPGTKSADMAAGPPLVPLNELDSAFQLQEHLAALHYYHTAGNTTPITRETAKLLDAPPPTIDRTLWLYELCRFLIKQCNSLIVGFLFDSPPCSAATCPEMRASEWQFLCAVHDAPKSCCAIDYCCHTLDWAANVVTNPKIFPSRFVALPDGHDRGTALKNLVNVFRRLHRIFAHAWFQHRGVFWSVESQTGLYVFFKTVCDLYDLLPAENYKLPPEAEGLETSTGTGAGAAADGAGEDGAGQLQQAPLIVTGIARPPSQELEPDDDNFQAVGRTNTRRHIRSSPSTGNAVATVPEVDEDDSTGVTSRLRDMHISEGNPEAESETADVPVIVMEDVDVHPPARRMSPQTSAEEVDPDPESESVPLAQSLTEEPPSEQPQPQPEVAEAAENVPEEPKLASEEESTEEPAASGEEVAEPVAEESEAADVIAKEEPSSEEVGDLTVVASEEEPTAEDGTKADDEKEAPAASSPGGDEPQAEETSTSPAEETTTEAQPPEDVKEAKSEDPKDATEAEEKKPE
jgi:hypothetical protein